MTPNEVRQIIKEELQELLASDRYIFHKTIQVLDGRNVIVAKGTGTMIGTEALQKLGFWGVAPVVQPSSTGEGNGVNEGAGVALTHTATYTGNFGTKAYTGSDIVKHLKTVGILLKS